MNWFIQVAFDWLSVWVLYRLLRRIRFLENETYAVCSCEDKEKAK